MKSRTLLVGGILALALGLGLGLGLGLSFVSYGPDEQHDRAQPQAPSVSPGESVSAHDATRGEEIHSHLAGASVGPQESKRSTRPPLLTDSPERLSALATITPSELQSHDAKTLSARSQRSRTLNDRLSNRLDDLKARRAEASEAEREELDHAIAIFERNRDLRAQQQVAPALPRRSVN